MRITHMYAYTHSIGRAFEDIYISFLSTYFTNKTNEKLLPREVGRPVKLNHEFTEKSPPEI